MEHATICMKLVSCKFFLSLFCFVLRVPATVPADVFAPNSAWSGFYEYLGKRQTTTFTVTDFNASSGRVNVTLLESSGVSIRMSGKEHMMTFRVRPCPHMPGYFSTYFISLGIHGKSPIKWCRVWPSLQAGLHTRMPISAHPVLRCSEHSRCQMASSCVMLSPVRKVKTFFFLMSQMIGKVAQFHSQSIRMHQWLAGMISVFFKIHGPGLAWVIR